MLLRILPVILVFATSNIFAQNGDNPAKYTDILPPSPAVAKLSDFSRPDVGMFTGTAQFHLPLTSLNAGGFSVPFAINYSSNGVKVDEISSRVGMGMQLEAGGVITRSVAGKGADEIVKVNTPPVSTNKEDRTFFSFIKDLVLGTSATDQPDGEPDSFNFTFCGQSGKFVLDNNRNVVQVGKSNLKFITNFGDTTWTFKIQDANGNEFLFGGKNYTEKSKKLTTCAKSYAAAIPTAWFLRKITLFQGEVINFVYAPVSYEYDLGVNQSVNWAPPLTLIDQTAPPVYDCACPPYSSLMNTCINYIKADTWYLTRAYSPNGFSVGLSYGSRNDSGDKQLLGLTQSFEGTVREAFQLTYDAINTTTFTPSIAYHTLEHQNRYFLIKVTRSDADFGAFIDLYRMSYNSPGSLPVRMSFAQDAYGYFNGKVNSSLIPLPPYPIEQWQFPTATGDRSTDTTLTKIGILTKIQYPTGGYDTITYQSNDFYETRIVYPTAILPINTQSTGTGPSGAVSVDKFFSIQFDQTVSFTVNCIRHGSGTAIPGHTGAKLDIYNTTTGLLVTAAGVDVDADGYTWTFRLPIGYYKATTTGSGSMAEASTIVNYIPGPSVTTTANWKLGGVRVGQIISKSYDGKLVGKHKFLYHDMGSANSSAAQNYQVIYNKDINFKMYCSYTDAAYPPQVHNCAVTKFCNYISLFSNPLINLFNPAGNAVGYKTVLESFDDANGNGLIEHKFIAQGDANAVLLMGNNPILGGPQTNASIINNGREKQTTWYSKTLSGYLPIKKKEFFYHPSSTVYKELLCTVANRLYTPCLEYESGAVQEFEWGAYEASRYILMCPWTKLDSTRDTDYTLAGDMFLTSTAYKYDSVTTLMPKITTTRDSKGNLEVTTSYYTGNTTLVPGADIIQQSLMNNIKTDKNAIGKLVYQEKLRNGNFNGSYRMKLSTFGTNTLQKDVIQQVVSGTDASMFSMLNYDSKGNVLERTKNNGVIYSYIWDYNQSLPIAEVTGSTVSDIALASFETSNLGNWTASGTITPTASSTSPTGFKYAAFANGAYLRKTGLTATRIYTVSYWSKTGAAVSVTGSSNAVTRPCKDGWTLTTMKVTGYSTVDFTTTTGGAIDDVRIYPETAKMVSYTHAPGVGVLSISDPNSVITYFNYDAFNRLVAVRDMNGNLLKTNQYHYSTYVPGTLPNTY